MIQSTNNGVEGSQNEAQPKAWTNPVNFLDCYVYFGQGLCFEIFTAMLLVLS